MKRRRHSELKYPEIENKIRSGEYSYRAPADLKKYSNELTWSSIRLIYDECDQLLKDYYICEKCYKIFYLKLRDSGQTLKRHVEICPGEVAGVSKHFVKKYPADQPHKRTKITVEDRLKMRDAAVGYVVNDMRPISSVNGNGMMSLMSACTFIGSKYGFFDEEAISEMKIVPSRQTVVF